MTVYRCDGCGAESPRIEDFNRVQIGYRIGDLCDTCTDKVKNMLGWN